uniref:Uncharacterized protein n=1 Tax=Timema douglasi TaxID=61478 RepID=A0A7R8VNW2_TIMDO|nr:unnamed protein product [Timema douglasi]
MGEGRLRQITGGTTNEVCPGPPRLLWAALSTCCVIIYYNELEQNRRYLIGSIQGPLGHRQVDPTTGAPDLLQELVSRFLASAAKWPQQFTLLHAPCRTCHVVTWRIRGERTELLFTCDSASVSACVRVRSSNWVKRRQEDSLTT